MKLMGFNFKKVSVEKFGNKSKEIKINSKIDVPSMKEVNSDVFKIKEQLISVDFDYIIDYAPDFAKIELSGVLVLALEPKLAKEVLKKWKDKEIPEDFKLNLFNLILKKSLIKALQIEDEMNLPLHIQLPFFKKQSE